MRKHQIGILLLLIATLPFGCTKGTDFSGTAATQGNKIQDVAGVQSVDVSAATVADCANGGIVYTIYLDANQNTILDEGDGVLKKYSVCNGTNGTNGSNGHNGSGVAFRVIAAPISVCTAGGSTVMMATDVASTGVYSIDAPNQQSMTICNGQNAVLPDYSPVEPILACGDNVAYKEVLLRLQNGQVLGSFSNDTGGTMTRLAFIPDGNYMNTDNSGCTFSLSTSTDGKTRSISWYNTIQKTWTMPGH